MKTILLVEDDSLIREGLARSLEDAGYNVLQAENGKQGLEQAAANNVDLLVTDISMPELDGLSMLAKLRKNSASSAIPAIVLSNDEQTESLNKAIEAGVTAYLSKSNLSAEAIVMQIATMLEDQASDA